MQRPSAQDEKPKPPPLTAGWRDGFVIQSEQGDFRLQIGALVHADGRFAAGDDSEVVNDTFADPAAAAVPARPRRRGTSSSTSTPTSPAARWSCRTPTSTRCSRRRSAFASARARRRSASSGCTRSSNLLFFERALPTALAPNRDVGVQVLGDARRRASSAIAAGVMNGVADGGSARCRHRTTARTSPAASSSGRSAGTPTSPLRGLALGVAGTTGTPGRRRRRCRRSARTSLQQPIFSYVRAPSPTASAPATRRRCSTSTRRSAASPSTCTPRLPVRERRGR